MEQIQPNSTVPDAPHRWATPSHGEIDRLTAAGSEDSYIEVGRLLSQFNRASPVKSIAEGVLGNTFRPSTSTFPLFTALAGSSGGHWREQVVAAWAMSRVPLDGQERDAAASMLLEALDRDNEDTVLERFLHGLLWGYGVMLPFCLIWSIVLCRNGENGEWADVFPAMLFVLGSMASILTIPLCVLFGRMNHHNGELLKAASAESLGRLHVRESIGPLAARLFDPSQVVSEAAAAALLRILPRLHEEDYGTIDHMALSHLADGLNHPNALLVFKILGALRMVGTGHTLPAVERIAREGKTRQIQESARSVAIVLEERRRREQESRHLMRSTSLTESLNDSLLHPYAAGSVQETIQLSSQARSSQDWL